LVVQNSDYHKPSSGHAHIVVLSYRLLKDKRVMDESFNSFLELKRGAARHTLESLMLLPVSICVAN